MQARLDKILGLRLRRTTSRGSLVSLPGSINTKKAYKKLINDLFAIGVTADMINEKEKEIKGIFGPQQADASSPINDSTSGNQGHQLPEVGDSSDAEASRISATLGNQSQLPNAGSSSDAEASPISPISKPKSRSRFGWARPPIDFLVGPRMIAAAEAGDTRLLISTLVFVRNINFTDQGGETALHKAAAGGHKDVVQLLLSKGALVDAMDMRENTPLHLAASGGHTSIVELLLSKGASLEAKDTYGWTPLHRAAYGGHTRTVRLLLSKGASAKAMNTDNRTPLDLATSSDIVKLLKSKATTKLATPGNIRTISG